MSLISSRNLHRLPSIDELAELMQSLAMLDAVLETTWSARRHHFNHRWAVGAQLGSINTVEGDSVYGVFTTDGALLKGFDHESPMSPWHNANEGVWPGVLGNLPPLFRDILLDPSLSFFQTTFCLWQFRGEGGWKRGKIRFPTGLDPDGSERLIEVLDGNPATYKRWAERYFERSVDIKAVKGIYCRLPLTYAMVSLLNPDRNLLTLKKDAEEIGYPLAI
jgi:hypothetical protein